MINLIQIYEIKMRCEKIKMKNFVSSIIYSLVMTFLSVAFIFLLQAPLISFIYYGFLSDVNVVVFGTNVINKVANTDAITIVVTVVQVILTLGFIISMFCFVKSIIFLFLKNEKLIRPYYYVFFFMTSIVPVLIIFLSVLLKVKLSILTFIIEGIFMVLNIVLITFSKKILPDTTDFEYRKYLFTEGSVDE